MTLEIFKRVLENLIAYGKRSVMTILGVTWGIASFILLMAYGDDFHSAMSPGMSTSATTWSWSGTARPRCRPAARGPAASSAPSRRMSRSIRQRCTLVKRVSPEVYDEMQLRWGDRMTTAGIRAVNDEYGAMRGMFMGEGRFLNAEDMAYMRRVVVLGYDLKKKLFSQAPALDQDVFINGICAFRSSACSEKRSPSRTTSPRTTTAP